MSTPPLFTAHNIKLVDGSQTLPSAAFSMEEDPRFISAKKVLDVVIPLPRPQKISLIEKALGITQNAKKHSVVDLGCLEGGYSAEFARLGYETLGIEVREINYNCCQYVKENLNLPNLRFVQDDVMNIANHGEFDAAFCCGLLYHLDRPKHFLTMLAKQIKKVIIIQTHFSLLENNLNSKYPLSPITVNEGLNGRWYKEFEEGATLLDKEAARWSSYENNGSFWIQREFLIELLYSLGFQTVFEQFDSLAPQISFELQNNYTNMMRGTFVGIKDNNT